jgi:hypothetical protein
MGPRAQRNDRNRSDRLAIARKRTEGIEAPYELAGFCQTTRM